MNKFIKYFIVLFSITLLFASCQDDYENIKSLSEDKSCVIFDDYDMNIIKKFINNKLNNKEILEYKDNNITELVIDEELVIKPKAII